MNTNLTSNSNAEANARELKSGVAHLQSLTGLRFVAAFAVFWSHAQYFLFPEVRNVVLGGPAVSFFFVLSGFILTHVYAGRLTRETTPRFWFTRWARLWPLHVSCMFIAILAYGSFPGIDPRGLNGFRSFTAQILMLQSWMPYTNWFTDFNAVSWSISTEMFFYAVFPVLLLFGGRKWFPVKLLLTMVVTFLFLCWWQHIFFETASPPKWMDATAAVIAFPLVRLCEFSLGMAACFLMRWRGTPVATKASKNRLQYATDTCWELLSLAVVVLVWCLLIQTRFANYLWHADFAGPPFSTWIRVSGGLFTYAFVIYVFATRRGALGQLLGSRVGVWLGEISFAFYLIHQVIIVKLHRMALADGQFMVCCIGIGVLASSLLYRIIEMPCRNALLAVYDGKPGWFGRWAEGIRGVLTSGTGWIQIIGLVLFVGALWFRPVNDINQQKCIEIANQTEAHLRNVRFTGEALLMGMEAKRVERGVFIRFAWVKARQWTRSRFLHLCDAEGEILGQGPIERKVFEDHLPNQPFIDEVLVHKKHLKDVKYIAVGFWSRDLECSPVESSHADRGFRMKLFDIDELEFEN